MVRNMLLLHKFQRLMGNKMKKVLSILTILLMNGFFLSNNVFAGKIVLNNDEWTLSNTGFSSSSDTGTFATNVASWFTGGSTGNFLAYSTNFGLTQNLLSSTMTSAGHSWTVSTGVTADLSTFSAYDGIFLAGNVVDNSLLSAYVNGGGNVYLAGGTGWGGPVNEAASWNTFLNDFGLGFGSFYNGVGGNIAINSTHDIFNSVSNLYQNNGNNALDIDISNTDSQLLVSHGSHGLYAVYDGTSAVPEPSILALFGAGILGLGFARRRKLRQS